MSRNLHIAGDKYSCAEADEDPRVETSLNRSFLSPATCKFLLIVCIPFILTIQSLIITTVYTDDIIFW